MAGRASTLATLDMENTTPSEPLAAARARVKTPGSLDSRKKQCSHFRYNAFLFAARVIRTTFSFFKFVCLEFSHRLAHG